MEENNFTLTEEQYQKLKADNLAFINQHNFLTDKLTCDDCPYKLKCEWSGDAYNIDGDCLADK
jgi:MoaA/NifB/PqqE/SkfB family radical SAM enzyme